MTARSDRDLTPDTIVQKVSDASGSKYAPKSTASIAPAPPLSSKPVYTPTNSSTGVAGSNTFAAQSRLGPSQVSDVDEDGWGADAPPVTRTSLEKVQASYEPTKINAGGFAPGGRSNDHHEKAIKTNESSAADVVRGGYQPVGKVDIAQIRAQSQRDGANDKAAPVKGAYEPVGKVDIAAIRAKAQRSTADESSTSSQLASHTESRTSLPDRSMPLHGSERLTALPKPKVASRFGSNAPSFVGTKAPAPGGFQSGVAMPTASTAQLGVGRTFADEGGKTPAQMWAEKKARDRGLSAGSESLESPVPSQNAQATASRGPDMTEWKSGYSGKSWAPVQTARTGQSSASTGESNPARNQETAEDTETAQSGSVGAIRHKLSGTSPSGAANIEEPASRMFPPALDMSNKPNAGQFSPITSSPLGPTETGTLQEPEARMPTPPPHPPRSPTPPTPPAVTGSPIRVAMPVSRGSGEPSVTAAHDEMMPQTAMPVKSLSEVVPKEDDISGDAGGNQDTGRRVAETMATGLEGESALPSQDRSELSALVQFDYEKAEDNELELREGEHVTAIETVDENWWMGQNARGESGLFPSNYVELIQSEEGISHDGEPSRAAQEDSQGPTATALYDYEAAEENELSFPEGATIQDIVSRTLPMLSFSFDF